MKLSVRNKQQLVAAAFIAAYVMVNILSWQLPFFWDTMTKGKRALWFYENGFQLLLPLDLDSGHPPFFPLYLASVWKLFGKSLLVSHLSMLPLLIGVAWQLLLLCRRFLRGQFFVIALLLLFLEPTLLAQSTMMSADLVMVFFYLLGLNSILRHRQWLLFLALAGLFATSMRGMVMGGSLLVTDAILHYSFWRKKLSVRWFSPYFFSGVLLFSWLAYHYFATGWLLFTPSEKWTAGRESVGLMGVLKNVAIILRNLFDFGRVFIYFFLFLFGIKWLKNKPEFSSDLQQLIAITAVPLVLLSLSFLPFSNPIGCRYYMVVYIGVTVVFVRIMQDFKRPFFIPGKVATGFLGLMLIGGHFWVYPDKIAKNWDSSLAHITYFDLRQKMNNYIEQRGLQPKQIGSQFPYISQSVTNLTEKNGEFPEYDLEKHHYIIQSNVINDFADADLDSLRAHWTMEKEYRNPLIYIRLYKKE